MGIWYYYDATGAKQGPINDQQLKFLVIQKRGLPETQLETDGGRLGKAGQVPGLFATSEAAHPHVQKTSPSQPSQSQQDNLRQETPRDEPIHETTVSEMDSVPLSQYTSAQKYMLPSLLNKWSGFYSVCAWIYIGLNVAILLLFLLEFLINFIDFDDYQTKFKLIRVITRIMMGCGGLTLVTLIFGTVGWFRFLNLAWSVIPEDIARTKPNKAVGYCFIPFFGFYWIFVALDGLTEGLNKGLTRFGQAPMAKGGWTTTLSVLACWILVPWLNSFLFFLWVVFSIVCIKNLKSAAVTLVLHK